MIKKLSLLAAVAALSACNGGDGNTTATANTDAPITPIPAPQGGDWTQIVTQTPAGGMQMGNPEAPVKVIEFASMTCPHCADFAREGEPKLVEEFVKSGRVSYEYRNYVTNPIDVTMSLITRCAGATPAFFKLTSQMFADQKAILDRFQAAPPAELQTLQSLPAGQQSQRVAQLAGLQEWAAQRGLPSAKTSQCLTNQAELDRLVQMASDATSQFPEFRGTPSFVVNGQLTEGPSQGQTQWQALEGELREALGS